MPDEVKPKRNRPRIVLNLDTESPRADLIVDAEQRAKEFAVIFRANQDRLQAVISAIDTLALDVGLKEVARKQFAQSLPRLSEGLTAKIQQVSTIFSSPLIEPEIIGKMPQVTHALATFDLGLTKKFAEIFKVTEILNPRLREQIQTLAFSLPAPDPFLSDIIGALDGDTSAAERVALRINWYPNQWQRECIRVKSRVEGISPEEVRKKALIQVVILALGWKKEDQVPIHIGSQSTWLYDDQQNLATVSPMKIPMQLFWKWVQEEAARAAGLWLVGHPYAPSVVLETPPDQNNGWQLARFTSLSTEEQSLNTRRGRPYGSGVFENGQAFLEEIKLAVGQVESRGNRVTQERVAEAMFQRSPTGSLSSDRQLRRWLKDFGYRDWRDLLNSL